MAEEMDIDVPRSSVLTMEERQPRTEPDEYGYARRLVCAYFHMLTVGCKDTGTCANSYCRSNSDFVELTPIDAAVKSILFATQDPVPICTVGFISPSECSVTGDEATEEDRPEVDEDEEGYDAEELRLRAEVACSPRRRLSHAVEMDLALNANESTREDDRSAGDGETSDRRHTSLHKQKLLNALRQSFPELPHELQVAKKR